MAVRYTHLRYLHRVMVVLLLLVTMASSNGSVLIHQTSAAGCGAQLDLRCSQHKLNLKAVKLYSGCSEGTYCLLDSYFKSKQERRGGACSEAILAVLRKCAGNSFCLIDSEELVPLVVADYLNAEREADSKTECDVNHGMHITMVVEYDCIRRKHSLSNTCQQTANMHPNLRNHKSDNTTRDEMDEVKQQLSHTVGSALMAVESAQMTKSMQTTNSAHTDETAWNPDIQAKLIELIEAETRQSKPSTIQARPTQSHADPVSKYPNTKNRHRTREPARKPFVSTGLHSKQPFQPRLHTATSELKQIDEGKAVHSDLTSTAASSNSSDRSHIRSDAALASYLEKHKEVLVIAVTCAAALLLLAVIAVVVYKLSGRRRQRKASSVASSIIHSSWRPSRWNSRKISAATAISTPVFAYMDDKGMFCVVCYDRGHPTCQGHTKSRSNSLSGKNRQGFNFLQRGGFLEKGVTDSHIYSGIVADNQIGGELTVDSDDCGSTTSDRCSVKEYLQRAYSSISELGSPTRKTEVEDNNNQKHSVSDLHFDILEDYEEEDYEDVLFELENTTPTPIDMQPISVDTTNHFSRRSDSQTMTRAIYGSGHD